MTDDFFNDEITKTKSNSKRIKLPEELLDKGIVEIRIDKKPRQITIEYDSKGQQMDSLVVPVLEFPYPTVDQLDVLVDGTMDLETITKLKGFLVLNLAAHWNKIYGSEKKKATDDDDDKTKLQIAFETVKQYTHSLFIDEYRTPFVAIPIEDHLEIFPIETRMFKNWYRMFIFERDGTVLDNQTINDLCSLASAYAASSKYGAQINLSLRTASRINGANNNELEWMYDLTNKNWEFVRITSNGWYIFKDEIIFRRFSNQQAQVQATREHGPDVFDRFLRLVNIKDDESIKLLLRCYIVSLFISDIQKPVLMLHGPQGAAKSSLEELIKMLVDPSIIKTLTFPRETNEFLQQLSHNYVVYYDNVSLIKEWISDLLCRAVSGSGSSKRQLYTDDDDIIRSFKRCVGFNGINLGATKADLLDRGLIIKLEEIGKKLRRKPEDIWNDFEQIRPQLLGYIFDILVKVLKWKNNGPRLSLELPRMSEFAEYGEMISQCMGYPENKFIDAYNKNIELQTEEVIESNQVALCLRELMFPKHDWTGTASDLLEELEVIAPDIKINIKSKYWPKSPSSLGKRLTEVIPSLRSIGLEIEKSQDDNKRRIIKIRKLPSLPSLLSENALQAQDNRAQSASGDGRDRRDGTLHTIVETETQAVDNSNSNTDTKVKCPTCDYETEPFYMKTHQCPNAKENKNKYYKFDCYECIKYHRKRFRPDSEADYKKHFEEKHPGKSPFPNQADLQKNGWKAQGKWWETKSGD